MFNFTEDQIERYSRHILLQDVGVEGQLKIMRGRVLIIGAGGLGSPAAFYLAAAGVGTIGIVDSDLVELSNLQRQILHFTSDVGKPKTQSAQNKINALNPDVKVQARHERVYASNIRELIADYDFVIDGTDNFSSKFLINDACVINNVAFSHGGILRFTGQTMTVIPGESTCYRCAFESPPPPGSVPTCSEAGVLGAVAGILGAIQAAEALKYLIGTGELIANALLTFDAFSMDFRKIGIRRNRDCPVCGPNPSITQPFDEDNPTCEAAAGPAVPADNRL